MINKIPTMRVQLLLLALIITGKLSLAQEKPEYHPYKLPLIGIGAGLLTFQGDVANNYKQTAFAKFRPGYNFSIEQRILPFLGAQISILGGKLSANELSVAKSRNFESKILQADLNLVFHFDNGFILKKNSNLAPYLGVGFGYLKFDAYTDIKDKNGNSYNYWKDGTLRDLPQVDSNLFKAKVIQRDYAYETQLTDPSNYKRNTFAIPLTAGITLKLIENIQLNLYASYYSTMTDWVDNIADGKNDAYLYSAFSIRYLLGAKKDEADEGIFSNIDFKSIDNLDQDGDGVKEVDDKCPGTPGGIKVDGKGCPLDADKDGVPDYIDKEANSKSTFVDENGVALTDAKMAQMAQDTLVMSREDALKMELMKKDAELRASGPRSAIPANFAFGDKDNNGIITSNEVTLVIDEFFEGGDSGITVEKINSLIDFFFDQ